MVAGFFRPFAILEGERGHRIHTMWSTAPCVHVTEYITVMSSITVDRRRSVLNKV